jgi:hypothetical protein
MISATGPSGVAATTTLRLVTHLVFMTPAELHAPCTIGFFLHFKLRRNGRRPFFAKQAFFAARKSEKVDDSLD